jgi:putative transcriptional regulator
MQTIDLTHHFLIAMPGMVDPNFARTLTYICEHNEDGALGVVVNRPIELTLGKLFEHIDLTLDDAELAGRPVCFGGPVQVDRGFVLHHPVGGWSSTLAVKDEVGFTTSRDILEAVASGRGPDRLLVSLGYAGWAPGQLEDEIGQNAWLTVGADPGVIFDLPFEERLEAAMRLLGVTSANLSEAAGHA